MKTWMKVAIGTLTGAVIGVAAAILGQHNDEDTELVEVNEETETDDSESNDEE